MNDRLEMGRGTGIFRIRASNGVTWAIMVTIPPNLLVPGLDESFIVIFIDKSEHG